MLLFRQAVLAALPHLQSSSSKASTKAIAAAGQQQQSWTRRKQQLLAATTSYRSLQDGESPAATTTTTTTTSHHNAVVDSGFSTEASNSNTSPRSSRFDTASSSEMTMPHPPMEKELMQHLERVQQRLARLKKDEDRLLTLLNRQRPSTQQQQQEAGGEDDELWLLLEEIQLRSQAIRTVTTKDAKPEEQQQQQQQQPMSHKKRVSFQQQQLEQQQQKTSSASAALPSPPAESSSSRYQPPTRDQVAAILRLTNPVQLQRHLLRALLDNQVTTPIRATALSSYPFFFFYLLSRVIFFVKVAEGASGSRKVGCGVERCPVAIQQSISRRTDDGLARRKRRFAVSGKSFFLRQNAKVFNKNLCLAGRTKDRIGRNESEIADAQSQSGDDDDAGIDEHPSSSVVDSDGIHSPSSDCAESQWDANGTRGQQQQSGGD